MTKKRLADLLKDEAHKSAELEPDRTQASDSSLTLDKGLDMVDIKSKTEHSSKSNVSADPESQIGNDKTELEAITGELKDALQAANRKEDAMQQQIGSLQSDLQSQKQLMQKLQEEIERASKVKAEFEEAKAVILKLTATNTNALIVPSPSPQPSQQLTANKRLAEDLRLQRLNLKHIPSHSIKPHSDAPPVSSSETDIEWFD